jgi:sterol desaturase/sphingolipid hydroxylase (fatty acid hydroxylase superfamily)
MLTFNVFVLLCLYGGKFMSMKFLIILEIIIIVVNFLYQKSQLKEKLMVFGCSCVIGGIIAGVISSQLADVMQIILFIIGIYAIISGLCILLIDAHYSYSYEH